MVGQRWKTPNSPLQTHLLIMFIYVLLLSIHFLYISWFHDVSFHGGNLMKLSWWSCDWNWPPSLDKCMARPAMNVTFTHARHHDHALLDKVVKNHAIWTFAVEEFINVPGWHTHLCVYIYILYITTCTNIYLSIYLSIYLCLSVRPSVRPSIHPSILWIDR